MLRPARDRTDAGDTACMARRQGCTHTALLARSTRIHFGVISDGHALCRHSKDVPAPRHSLEFVLAPFAELNAGPDDKVSERARYENFL